MIGDRIRAARKARSLSLAQVASQAHISAATLSRIETNKQLLEFQLFLNLASILGIRAASLLDEGPSDGSPLAERIEQLDSGQRAHLWRELAASSAAEAKLTVKKKPAAAIAADIEGLLAHLDILREEIQLVRERLNGKRGRRDPR
jgi:transcriptional regulator with XRE-family HTH domain